MKEEIWWFETKKGMFDWLPVRDGRGRYNGNWVTLDTAMRLVPSIISGCGPVRIVKQQHEHPTTMAQ